MEKFTYAELLAFLASNKDELEYFGCDKQELISLYDYLNEIKNRYKLYQEMIFTSLETIKSKNRWVKNIIPARDINPDGLVVYGNSDPTFTLGITDEDFIRIGGSYSSPFCQTKLKYRTKLLDNSQDELHEINNIAHDLNIENQNMETVSGNFNIDISMFDKCYIDIGSLTLSKINILDQKIIANERFVKKGLFHIREGILANYLDQEQTEKLIRKLYVRK